MTNVSLQIEIETQTLIAQCLHCKLLVEGIRVKGPLFTSSTRIKFEAEELGKPFEEYLDGVLACRGCLHMVGRRDGPNILLSKKAVSYVFIEEAATSDDLPAFQIFD